MNASAAARGGNPDLDGIRRKYLRELSDLTHRDVILYSTAWLSRAGPSSAITLMDMQGMMEVCRGLSGPGLDLVIHSPGGSPEATASIVRYLRRKFSHIRAFVPLAAMSAATMLALASDEIWMGKHSQLGPIDPQLVTSQSQFPARAVIEQFERAKAECSKDPSLLGAWIPILQQYGPALIQQCEDAERLARRLVGEWLEAFMFAQDADAAGKAEHAANYFADYSEHQSHSLGIDRDQARNRGGVKVLDLEVDQALQDAVLSVHHATILTFQGSAVKIIENQLGRAFVQQEQLVPMNPPTSPAVSR